jgi:hypothetical protein
LFGRGNFQFLKTQTSSPAGFRGKKAVNNSRSGNAEDIDSVGSPRLLTRFSHADSGEQGVHINSLSVGRFAV